MHAIDGMACATRGCDNRGKLGLNIVGHGSFPTKWGRRWRYRWALLHEYPLPVGRRGSHFSGPSAGATLQG